MTRKQTKKTAKPRTEIAVRPRAKAPTVTIEDPRGLLPVAQSPVGQLGELATVGALGMVELKLTDAEEAVLSRPTRREEILIKPDGTIYLPWAGYSKWFTEAFGRFGWRIVPAGRPNKVDNLVLMPYMLWIHGQPVAFAYGEQDYHPDNKRQTYGDAIESTRASALRRCAKQFDIGVELWDKRFIAEFIASECVQVNVNRRGDTKKEWRRKIDPPLPGEIQQRRAESVPSRQPDRYSADTQDVFEAEPVSSQLDADAVITAPQRKRLDEIRTRAGRLPADVSLWLRTRYKVASSAQIKRRDYAEICRMLEARGTLPLPGDGGE